MSPPVEPGFFLDRGESGAGIEAHGGFVLALGNDVDVGAMLRGEMV